MPNEILNIDNFPDSVVDEVTTLTDDANASQNLVNVLNPDNFAIDDFVVVGNLGGEKSQLTQISLLTGAQLTLAANLLNKHYQNEPLTRLKANQWKIYRAVNVDGTEPASADFSTLAGTVNIQVDQKYTEFVDTVGGSGYWYLAVPYNSDTDVEGSKDSAVKVRGGNYGLYADWLEVRDEAGLTNNRWIPSTVYQDKLVKAQSEVNASVRVGGYVLPLAVVPEVIKHATILLAAGYVLTRDYGPENAGTSKDGERKIKQAREILKSIEDGSQSLTDDTTGDNLANDTPGRVAGYPDDASADTEPRMFTTNSKF